MSNEQLRVMVQSDISTLLTNYMSQNNLPAYIMEDAVNKYMLTLKEAVMQEFIRAISVQESAQEEQEDTENGEQQ